MCRFWERISSIHTSGSHDAMMFSATEQGKMFVSYLVHGLSLFFLIATFNGMSGKWNHTPNLWAYDIKTLNTYCGICGNFSMCVHLCSQVIGTGCRVHVFSLILDSSVGLSVGIRSPGDLVSETLGSNLAFSRGRHFVSFQFEYRLPVPEHRN